MVEIRNRNIGENWRDNWQKERPYTWDGKKEEQQVEEKQCVIEVSFGQEGLDKGSRETRARKDDKGEEEANMVHTWEK